MNIKTFAIVDDNGVIKNLYVGTYPLQPSDVDVTDKSWLKIGDLVTAKKPTVSSQEPDRSRISILADVDTRCVRPLTSIVIALLDNKEPNSEDVAVLRYFEESKEKLRNPDNSVFYPDYASFTALAAK